MPDPKIMEKYVTMVLKQLGQENLSKVEEVLGTKLKETQDQADNLRSNIEKMRDTMRQAEERFRGMNQEYMDTLSKAEGFAESLIALKFGDQIKKEQEETKSKGNGSRDPTNQKKKARKPRLLQAAE